MIEDGIDPQWDDDPGPPVTSRSVVWSIVLTLLGAALVFLTVWLSMEFAKGGGPPNVQLLDRECVPVQ